MTKQDFGRQGEDKAVAYLQEAGYLILERNWRLGHKEVDIICTDGEKIVIVEVKAREKGAEYPAELLDWKKRRNLLRAGAAYLQQHGLERELRFDLIIVNGEKGEVAHIPEAIQVFD